MKRLMSNHTGGAWKVAYADFVTSMMCLFLVLWIMAMRAKDIRESIASFFQTQSAIRTQRVSESRGIYAPMTKQGMGDALHANDLTPAAGTGGRPWAPRLMMFYATLGEAANQFLKSLQPNLPGPEVVEVEEFRMEYLTDGFRLNVLDRSGKPIFEEGGAKLTEHGLWVLQTIAWEIQRFPFQVEVEGHVRANESMTGSGSDEWDLSTKRALVAYQGLIDRKVPAGQFSRVAGYADRQPLEHEPPGSELNRRLTVVLRVDPNANLQDLRRAYNLP